MVTFNLLRERLLDNLRARIRNGELTERRLARMTGISQPHMHNLLKGVRSLTAEMGDEILRSLHLSLSQFSTSDPLPAGREQQLQTEIAAPALMIGFLRGQVGPAHPWPVHVSNAERFRLPPRFSYMINPLAARMGADARMTAFCENDVGLLDQGFSARTEIEALGLYLIKQGGNGLVRRARRTAAALYIFSDDCAGRPSAWQRMPLASIPVEQTIRARVYFPSTEDHWQLQVA